MGLNNTRWFIILSGEHEGKPHLSGWMLSAIKGEPISDRDNGWLSYATCPRCFAMVTSDNKHPFGDRTWAHEQWHAQTDFPIPDDLIGVV
jgi:hypothetical protein